MGTSEFDESLASRLGISLASPDQNKLYDGFTLLSYSENRYNDRGKSYTIALYKNNIKFQIRYTPGDDFGASVQLKTDGLYSIKLVSYESDNKTKYRVTEMQYTGKNQNPNPRIGIYAVADDSYVLEVLLAKLFANDRGISAEDGESLYTSYLCKNNGQINMNCKELRPYYYTFNKVIDDTAEDFPEMNDLGLTTAYQPNTNYIDVAFDDSINNIDYCMIIDAKNYGVTETESHTKYTPNMPDKDSIMKQYLYQNIMKRYYIKYYTPSDHSKVLELYNIFVLPIHSKKMGLEEKATDSNPFVFSGIISDSIDKKTILLLRADMEVLINQAITNYTQNDAKQYQRTRDDFYNWLINEIEQWRSTRSSADHDDEIIYTAQFKYLNASDKSIWINKSL